MKNDKNTASPVLSQKKLLALSFVEGSCVMVAELAGGKMLAPFYGTSLYVWASTLAITLGGLTMGYYIGGELSKRDLAARKKALFLTLAVASALVIIMPVWANFIMQRTLDMDFLTGVIISQLFFLLPPIVGMGMVSPMLISMIAENNQSGKAAGLVYAVSTLGGVIATMLTGFWLVPLVGISIPCVVVGALLFLLSIIILRPSNKLAPLALVILLIPSVFFIYGTHFDNSDKYKVVYYSEGMLGQVKVVDFTYTGRNRDSSYNITSRVMLVNHNWQTWVDKKSDTFSFLYYTRFTRAIISSLPKGSNALLIGLGGGTVARQMERYDVNYNAVEIDGRLPHLAEKFFGLKKAVANTVVDDGRHYVNVCKKKYDLIIIDALLGENVPSHLLSLECFQHLKTLLTPNGKIFIEFDGVNEDETGIAQSALKNTLEKAGYHCRTFSSFPQRTDYDMMYVATKDGATSYDTAQIIPDYYYPFHGPLKTFEVTLPNATTDIVTDNNPSLDYYLRDRMVTFRQKYLLNFNKDFLDDQMPFFH